MYEFLTMTQISQELIDTIKPSLDIISIKEMTAERK